MQTNFSVTEKEQLTGLRKSYIFEGEEGAIELWRLIKLGSLTTGGIKIHSRVPFSFAPDAVADHQDCHILDNSPCWTHASESSYFEFTAWNDFDDHQDVKRELSLWYTTHFNKKV